MARDYLQAVVAVVGAWKQAHSLLCKEIKAALEEQGTKLKLPGRPASGGLTLDVAVSQLKVALHGLRGFRDVDGVDFPWLVMGGYRGVSTEESAPGVGLPAGKWWPYPLESKGAADRVRKFIHRLKGQIGLKGKDGTGTVTWAGLYSDHTNAPGFWQRNVEAPIKEHAEQVRAWIKGVKQEAGRGKPSGTPPPTPLQRQVLEIIKNHPNGIKGPQIISALAKEGDNLDQSTLTRHIIPELKEKHHVRNRRGAGYYIEAD
jgi:hypothetical protein